MLQEREVREMRDAETILSIIRDRGRRGLPLERVYRLLFNPNLYLTAYGKIYRNAGAMTPGSTEETVDGMSLAKIEAIIDVLRHERYRWRPARRVYIEKPHSSKLRLLGLPTWSDKLLQEIIRLILEAYYEPQFSDQSHGFRPGRGCHTALTEIQRKWVGTAWFIEGDISDCFGSLDHEILISILSEKIHDGRFLRLIENLLKAGYLEDWKFNATLSGSPQGGIVSPILSNIYLDRLDKFVEKTLLPQYNRKTRRKTHSEYLSLTGRARRLANKGEKEEARELRKRFQRLPSKDPNDPDYRRLRYARYADDFLLGFSGPREEAEEIQQRLTEHMRDELKLELSKEKTLITHARSEAARFLGYEITVMHGDHKHDRKGRRTLNGGIGLKVPADVVRAKCALYMRHGKPIHRPEVTHDSVFSIVARYQQEFRGIVEYYRLAYNLSTQLDRLKWVMETSLTKTLAHKLRGSVSRKCTNASRPRSGRRAAPARS
jgi:group II intron reverse transcriptase/maturase